jgi:hypothetical protein
MPGIPVLRGSRWNEDPNNFDNDDAIAAEGHDWTYHICPVRGENDEVIGYQVAGGDFESGDHHFGSSLVDGEPGELTLQKAKASAQANYASRYLEADKFLDGLLGDWEDDDGLRTRWNELGRIMCRVDELEIGEVEVVATLQDYGDGYNAGNCRVTVCLRTILSWESDPGGLLDELHQIIRREIQRGRDNQ